MAQAVKPAVKPAVAPDFGGLPMSFTESRAAGKQTEFHSKGPGYGLSLSDRGVTLTLRRAGLRSGRDLAIRRAGGRLPRPASGGPLRHPSKLMADAVATDTLQMQLVGGDSKATAKGFDALPGTTNYFLGNDPAKWQTHVPTFAKVRYSGIYPGVDLVYYGNQRKLEYDFVVAPHADPGQVRLRFSGAQRLKLDRLGNLLVSAANGEVAFERPVIYQDGGGRRLPVEGRYAVLRDKTVGFRIGRYDRSKPLVIDPTLSYSTYLGGSTEDASLAIAVDAAGSIYVTGFTGDADFPVTAGAIKTTNTADNEVSFVAKLNPAGTALVYSTYLGGTATTDFNNDSEATGLAVDGAGNAYVCGETNSNSFPVTPGAFQATNKGSANNAQNVFVSKLSADGTALVYSTYLGGSGLDIDGSFFEGDTPLRMAIDTAGNAYVVGTAYSTDFPLSAGAFQATNKAAANAASNVFVTKLNPSGTALAYSTYLGGSGISPSALAQDSEEGGGDQGYGITVDAAGEAYVSGYTYSADFPVTANGYQQVNHGTANVAVNAFVSRLNADGTALLDSTYLGGTGVASANESADGNTSGDESVGVALDAAGNVYTTGVSTSTDFPTTQGAYQTTNKAAPNLAGNVFVSKLDPTLTNLLYSTYIGGSGIAATGNGVTGGGDFATGIAVDGQGDAYITGATESRDFPVTGDAFQVAPRSSQTVDSGFFSELNPTAGALIYSTYLGGSGAGSYGGTQSAFFQGDFFYDLALDGANNAYLTGYAYSYDFPVTKDAFQSVNNAGGHPAGNAFIAKFGATAGATYLPTTTALSSVTTGANVTFTALVTGVAGAGIPTGSVTFYVDGAKQTTVTLDGNGSATFTTDQLSDTLNNVIAAYSGSAVYGASGSSLGQNPGTTGGTATQLIFTVPPAPSIAPGGNGGTVVVTVEDVNGAAVIAPAVTVTITITGPTGYAPQTLTSTSANGTATFDLGNNPLTLAGVYTYTASGGGLVPAIATESVSGNTGLTPTTLTLAVNPTFSFSGQPVTLTATLAPFNGTNGSTDGEQVVFQNGGVPLASGTLANGVATLTTTALPAGADLLTAVYGGDANFQGSTSNPISYDVTQQAATATTLGITVGENAVTTVASGTPVALTATVTVNGDFVSPGTVKFCDATAARCADSALLGTAQLTTGGTAVLRFLPPLGTHSYNAVFVGTNGDATSVSATSPLTVTGTVPTTTTIAATGAPGTYLLSGTVTTTGALHSQASVFVVPNQAFTDTGIQVNAGQALFISATGELDWDTNNTCSPTQSCTNGPDGSNPPTPCTGEQVTATNLVCYSLIGRIGINGTPFQVGSSFSAASLPASGELYLGVNDGYFGDNTLGWTAFIHSSLAPTGTVSFLDTTSSDVSLGTASLGAATAALNFANQNNPYTVGPGGDSVVIADFNGDGKLDIAVASSGPNTRSLTILAGDGAGNFATTISSAELPELTALAVGDFNGDGLPDLAISRHDSNLVEIDLNNGAGVSIAPPSSTSPMGLTPVSPVVADFNGDGRLDVAVANSGGNTVTVLLGNGDGTMTPAAGTPSTGATPTALAVGDFNADGRPDLAVVNNGDKTVTVLLGNGDGSFTAATGAAPSTGFDPVAITVGDFNGDGIPDLAVANNGDSDVTILLGQGDGTFAAAAGNFPQSSAGPTSIVTGDFNGDGKLDLATANNRSSSIAVLLGNGDGTFATTAASPATGAAPVSLASADVNGDGAPDLITANNGVSVATVLLTQQTQTAVATVANVVVPGTGTHDVEASYPGDNNFGGSVSATTPLTGSRAGQASLVFSTPPPAYLYSGGSGGNVAVTVQNGNPTAVAQVTLTISGTSGFSQAIGPTAAVNGVATFDTSIYPLPTPGVYTFTATSEGATPAVATVTVVSQSTSLSPSQAVGTGTAPQTVTLVFNQDSTLSDDASTIQALTQGAANLDFTLAPTQPAGACEAAQTYVAGQSCVESVVFTPIAPGLRMGAVVLTGSSPAFPNNNNRIVASAFLSGVGEGPLVDFAGSAPATIAGAPTVSAPEGIAVDAAGDVFIADSPNGVVLEVPAGGGAPITLNFSELNFPVAVAVDGLGDIYVVDQLDGGSVVYELPLGGAQQTIYQSEDTLAGLAVDAIGNIYFSDQDEDTVFELQPGGFLDNLFGESPLNGPEGLAMDAAGDIFIADTGNRQIVELGADRNSVVPVVTGLGNEPNAVAVDPAGNLYIAESQGNAIVQVSATGALQTTYTQGIEAPLGVALDGLGNVFVASPNTGSAVEFPRSAGPTLTFAPQNEGTTSAPQALGVQNSGNQPLSFSAITVPSNFALDAASTTCVTSANVAPGAACNFGAEFSPALGAASGSVLTGLLRLDDNAPNVFQSVGLTGTAIATQSPQTINFAPIAAQTYGAAPLTVTATSSSELPVTITVQSGPATVAGNVVTITGTGTVVLAANQGGDANYLPAQAVTQSFTVAPAVLTVAANSFTTLLGQAIPTLTDTITGFVYNDTAANATTGAALLSTTATAASPAGTYPITAAQGTLAAANYTFTFVPGSLTIVQALTLTPASLTFAVQTVGTQSAPQIITLTNSASVAYDIQIILSLGLNPSDFTQTNNCPTPLAAGASCQISVVFAPAGVGPKSAGLQLSDNSPVPTQGVNMTGTGAGGILQVNPGNLKTIAGTGVAGYTGDGGSALNAELNDPDGIAFDAAGNLYVADVVNNVIRKVDTAGNITTVAGNGTAGFSGDGGPATSAQLNGPFGVAADATGNLYVLDTLNNRIRKVDTAGTITTFAGSGKFGFSGDGGPATAAQLSEVQGARFDSAGNLYVPQCGDSAIRKIDVNGIITTVAGNGTDGFSGDGGAATSAQLDCPSGVVVSPAGEIFIADYLNDRIRKVDANGIITTIAGNGTPGFTGDGGPALAAEINIPNDLNLDAAGNLYIADSGNNRIRKIDTGGNISTVVGGLNNAGSAGVNAPSSIAFDAGGNLYFSDAGNNAIREVFPAGAVVFAATPIGTAATAQKMTLANIGNVPVTIGSSASFTLGGNSADFSLAGGSCLTLTAPLSPAGTAGSSCELDIGFTPTATGTRTVTISIADDAVFSPQSFTASGSGTAATTTLTVSASSNTVVAPAAVSLTATLASAASGASGAVNFFDGTTGLGQAVLNASGTATLNGVVLAVGAHAITASYPGSANFAAATSPAITVVVQPPGALSLTSIAPTGAPAGAPDTTITAIGTSFTKTSVIDFNGAALATTFVSGTQLTAVVPAALLTAQGTAAVTVTDTGSGATTPPQTFTILAALAVTFSGPPSSAPGEQPTLNFQLQQPYATALTGTMTLTFTPDNGNPDDPQVQFATGGRTFNFSLPANTTLTPLILLQAGTTSGTITVTLQLSANGVNVTPPSLVPIAITVPKVAPTISSVAFSGSGDTLTVVMTGYSSSREIQSATFYFTPAAGQSLAQKTVTVTPNSIFATWYSGPDSAQFGSSFTYTQVFNLSGPGTTIGGVSATLTNTIGTSTEVAAQ